MSPFAPGARPTVGELWAALAERMRAPEMYSEGPRHEAAELLAHALGLLPRDLEARIESRITEAEHSALLGILSRRLSPEPTAYIVGGVEIGPLRFKVDRRGFIPRLDLTVLVEAGLAGVPLEAKGRALDLASGIGAAGICVAHARPGLLLDLADVSPEAIELARENAELHVPGRASCWSGDLFGALPADRRGSYIVITANPPWVPDGTVLPDEVIDHEPNVSFFGGPDGLDLVRRIISELGSWLAPGGIYAQECDPSQVTKVLELLRGVGLVNGRAHADAEGVLRVVSAVRA